MGREVVIRGTLPIVLCLAWQYGASAADSPFFPPLLDILERMRDRWFSGPASDLFLTPAFRSDVGSSIGRLLLGYGLGVVLGVGLGVLLGMLPRLAGYIDPVAQFFRSVPKSSLVPMFILLFGVDNLMKIILMATAVLFPVFINTMDGVRNVDRLQLDTARTFGVPLWRKLTKIVMPSTLPQTMAGCRIALSVALVMLIISEMVAGNNGLGYLVAYSQDTFRILDMWAGVVMIGLVGNLAAAVFVRVERHLLRWRPGR